VWFIKLLIFGGAEVKRIKLLAALAALGLLAGCVTFEQVDKGLSTLKGKTLNEVIAILGYPDAERTIAGKKIYTWANRNAGTYTLPTTNTVTTWVDGYPVTSTVYGSTTESYDYHCKVDVIFGKNVVEEVQYKGNLGGCEQYAKLAKQ